MLSSWCVIVICKCTHLLFVLQILVQADQARSRPQSLSASSTVAAPVAANVMEQPPKTKSAFMTGHRPPTRIFTPISYCVPVREWDVTPADLKPLSWYLTDSQVANIIYNVYTEEDIGRWNMFADNVEESPIYFHRPYGYAARELGYRNYDESSAWLPSARRDGKNNGSVEQCFDAEDVMQLPPQPGNK